jgi:hypothetical protein
MRESVMELGRFTLGGSGGQPATKFDYAPRGKGTQCEQEKISPLRTQRNTEQPPCVPLLLVVGIYFGLGAVLSVFVALLGCLAMIMSLTLS